MNVGISGVEDDAGEGVGDASEVVGLRVEDDDVGFLALLDGADDVRQVESLCTT